MQGWPSPTRLEHVETSMISRPGIHRRLLSLHIRTWIVGGTLLNNENIVVELYTAAIPAILAMPLFYYDDTMCCSAVRMTREVVSRVDLLIPW